MTMLVPILLFSLPCALGAWLWWTTRSQCKPRKPRRVVHPSQRFDKIKVIPPPIGSAQPKKPSLITPDDVESLKQTHIRSEKTETPSPFVVEKVKVAEPKQTGQDGMVHFIKGERYLLESGTVYECMGFKGIKNRRVAFSDYGFLEYWPEKRNRHPDYFDWFSIRYDGDVETCDRGRIRSDCVASNHEADSYAKLLKDRFDGEREYWAKRKEKRERDEKRLKQLERLVKENGLE